jgi:hypothetical protein
MIWTDVTGCGPSEAQPKEGTYELRSPGWNSTIGGVMLKTWGHLHDGGIYTTLFVNDKPVCRSDSFYGTKDRFVEKPGVPNLSSKEQMGVMDAMKDGKMNTGMIMGSSAPSAPVVPVSNDGGMNPMQGMEMGTGNVNGAPTNSSATESPKAEEAEEIGDKQEEREKQDNTSRRKYFNKKLRNWLLITPDRRTSTVDLQAPNLQHITDVSICTDFGILHPGDVVDVRAVYDTSTHSLNRAMHMGWEGIVAWLATAPDKNFA